MKKILIAFGTLILFYGAVFYAIPLATRQVFDGKIVKASEKVGPKKSVFVEGAPKPEMTHLKAPFPLHGLYFSSWAAGSDTFRKRMDELFATGAINTVVIDIKDSTGHIGFLPNTESLQEIGSAENRIPDVDAFIQTLHNKGIYVIGRVAVFEDDFLAREKPEWALIQTGTTKVWTDDHHLAWLDPQAQGVWKYVTDIANEGYARGFDEINFDYIRFPSDGGKKKYTRQFSPETPLPDALKGFFNYVDTTIDKKYPISFDIFGMTTTAQDDMGIGQVFENIIPHGDYTMPMVYPSHYGSGNFGFKNPADHPYEVVLEAMKSAATRAQAINIPKEKLRSWLQDFDLGATYGPDKVLSQMKASIDGGVHSWILWDASNKYTKEALLNFAKFEKSNTQPD